MNFGQRIIFVVMYASECLYLYTKRKEHPAAGLHNVITSSTLSGIENFTQSKLRHVVFGIHDAVLWSNIPLITVACHHDVALFGYSQETHRTSETQETE